MGELQLPNTVYNFYINLDGKAYPNIEACCSGFWGLKYVVMLADHSLVILMISNVVPKLNSIHLIPMKGLASAWLFGVS